MQCFAFTEACAAPRCGTLPQLSSHQAAPMSQPPGHENLAPQPLNVIVGDWERVVTHKPPNMERRESSAHEPFDRTAAHPAS